VRCVPRDSVRTAIVLAAGNGDRFVNGTKDSKLLHPLLGQPLLLRTLTSAHEAGIESTIVVLGYQAERVRQLVERRAPVTLSISFAYNPEWRLENGLSVLAARPLTSDQRFAVLMGDHVFEPAVLRRLLSVDGRVDEDESVLAVDARPAPPEVVAEATKVLRDGSRVVAIGKHLSRYDALDTGLFVCSPMLFDALETARAESDTTLSGGVRELARRGLMRAHEIGDATWCDIDTVSDLEAAESALTVVHEPA
jgi:1L-myo-inositol 1-phosphate cytidylyltransferase